MTFLRSSVPGSVIYKYFASTRLILSLPTNLPHTQTGVSRQPRSSQIGQVPFSRHRAVEGRNQNSNREAAKDGKKTVKIPRHKAQHRERCLRSRLQYPFQPVEDRRSQDLTRDPRFSIFYLRPLRLRVSARAILSFPKVPALLPNPVRPCFRN